MPPKYEYPPTEFDPKPRRASGLRSYIVPLLSIAAAVAIIDRITKHIIRHRLPEGSARTIIPGILRITHVLNTGAAFSMFSDSARTVAVRHGLVLFSVVAIFIVLGMLWRVRHTLSLTSIALALILGGAIGNVYDRVRYHYVVDFIEVHIFHYHWPDFNVADSCIVIGACLLFIEIFRSQPATQSS
jgi:signal peptidase II